MGHEVSHGDGWFSEKLMDCSEWIQITGVTSKTSMHALGFTAMSC